MSAPSERGPPADDAGKGAFAPELAALGFAAFGSSYCTSYLRSDPRCSDSHALLEIFQVEHHREGEPLRFIRNAKRVEPQLPVQAVASALFVNNCPSSNLQHHVEPPKTNLLLFSMRPPNGVSLEAEVRYGFPMYLPARYSASDSAIEELIHNHPLATVITPQNEGPMVSHLPLVLEKRGDEWVLIGHLARANPHASLLESAEALVIFHGPEAYVTPLWYEQCDVPTWNYTVAHLHGRPRLLENEADTIRTMKALSARTEGPKGWQFEIPEDLAKPGVLMRAIVGFEIPVRQRVGKFKLSQNKSSSDFSRVVEGLSTRKDERSQQVAHWMQRLAR